MRQLQKAAEGIGQLGLAWRAALSFKEFRRAHHDAYAFGARCRDVQSIETIEKLHPSLRTEQSHSIVGGQPPPLGAAAKTRHDLHGRPRSTGVQDGAYVPSADEIKEFDRKHAAPDVKVTAPISPFYVPPF
jgi:hypothetical protein